MTGEIDGSASPTERGIGRRTVVKAAAWSVPAIVIATAAPAAATASGTMMATSAFGVRHGLTINFTVHFSGTSPGPHTGTISGIHIPGVAVSLSPLPKNFSLPDGGGDVTFTILLVHLGSSRVATISYIVNGHGDTKTITAAF